MLSLSRLLLPLLAMTLTPTLAASSQNLGSASPSPHHSLSRRASGSGVTIPSSTMQQVITNMNQLCQQSWENGTRAEALLEYQYPDFSVYANGSITLPFQAPTSIPPALIDIAETALVAHRPASFANNRSSSLVPSDGSAADPASMGIAVLLANSSQGPGQATFSGTSFGAAAASELEYLLTVVPRSSEGAISHRAEQVQLWADSVYMVPPFLAYYGLVTANQTLLQAAYDQCRLYRQALQDTSTQLWKHIQLGTGTSDPGLWATGNAWAAAGMLRVLATIRQSSSASDMSSQTSDLASWVGEILGAASQRASKDGLLHNYIDNSSSFEDTAGSALMGSAALRLSTLGLNNDYVTFGEQIHSTIGARYLNSSGYLTHAVDPIVWDQQGDESPEGQAFVVLLQAAYDDYRARGGSDTTSGAGERLWSGVGGAGLAIAGVVVLATMLSV